MPLPDDLDFTIGPPATSGEGPKTALLKDSLKTLERHLRDLVLLPDGRVSESELDAFRGIRDACRTLVDRGPRHLRNETQTLFALVDRDLSLLTALYGPQALEVREVEVPVVPSVDDLVTIFAASLTTGMENTAPGGWPASKQRTFAERLQQRLKEAKQ